MANLVTFAKKLWKDATSGGTPITAAELNRMEGGISDCATQINRLGDSVSQQPKIITGVVIIKYADIHDSRAVLLTRAAVESIFGSRMNIDRTAVLLTNSNSMYGKTTMVAEYDDSDSVWYVRFASAPNSNVQVTYAVIY